MNKGRLIVFSAPSGCGKGTMLGEIMKDERFRLSVSATTRDPRPGEIDGVNYHFITREEFEKRIEIGEFLEHAEYCGNLYGSLVNEADPYLEQGLNVVLEIEVQGAMQIREKRPDALFVFIAPPSMAEIRRRLLKRGTETPEVIEQRIAQATMELGYALAEKCWGKGYMTEAAKALMKYAFEKYNLVIMAIRTSEVNRRSQRVIEKCGFKYEGTIRKAYHIYTGLDRDSRFYSITREEWEETNEK